MHKFTLRCVECGATHDPYSTYCDSHDSLLRTEYLKKQLIPRDLPGIWKYCEWLPVDGVIPEGSAHSVTYQSEGLAKELGLENLYISFNGYWPEREAWMMTCSFKDLESFPTMQRLLQHQDQRVMVVASAGNTARAFAHVASITGQPLLLVVPEMSKHRLWIPGDDTSSICTVGVKGDYYSAIELASKISSRNDFVSEGGARNVARRDGMGTVMLDATLTTRSLPQHYFQAVGSGTGGIAAWEAAMRLVGDGRFGNQLPRLHLAQNLPCAPLYAMHSGVDIDSSCPKGMCDDVLFNRQPPYGVRGGVRDALDSTDGVLYGITNKEAEEAKGLFEETEGIDILNAPSVAIAALIQAVQAQSIDPHDHILLNITGGGKERLEQENATKELDFDLTVSPTNPEAENEIIDIIRKNSERGTYNDH
ncbi:MAG: cysteate synthase [Euryarchaeota archaeon]|nr:cysteate synthase [Euryarchaeota archaeon]